MRVFFKSPVLTVIVRSFSRQRVQVDGEINTMGLIVLLAGMTALQAVFQSEGFREMDDPTEALIIRKGYIKQPIPIQIGLDKVMNARGRD
jgi:protein involved in polysaccharide export with SLBB domain